MVSSVGKALKNKPINVLHLLLRRGVFHCEPESLDGCTTNNGRISVRRQTLNFCHRHLTRMINTCCQSIGDTGKRSLLPIVISFFWNFLNISLRDKASSQINQKDSLYYSHVSIENYT